MMNAEKKVSRGLKGRVSEGSELGSSVTEDESKEAALSTSESGPRVGGEPADGTPRYWLSVKLAEATELRSEPSE